MRDGGMAPFRGLFFFSALRYDLMERIRNTGHISVIREELVAPRSGKIESSPIQKIDRALAAAANNLDEAREAFEMLCGAIPDGAGDAVRALPVLLTVPQVCNLLGYHKTKVYDLMKRGLLPYAVETKTGHRRVEYRAVQHLVKRLRGGRLEGKAS
jgi:excisionase family DNA binding protein